MKKTDFLSNIAERLRRTPGDAASPRNATGVPEFWADRTMDRAAQTNRFVESFTGLGGEITFFDTPADLHTGLSQLLTELAPQHVGAWGKDAAWLIDVEALLDEWNALRWDETSPQTFADVQLSITGCAYAIADTGTIVMESSPAQGRGAHVLPLVHVVLMREAQIRLRLGEVFDGIRAGARASAGTLPASVHFVSGPSRSSDIENDQSIGVHGPARVIAFVLREG